MDNLSLFIRRNSRQCDISVGSDRLITDTFLHGSKYFLALAWVVFTPTGCHGVRLHLALKKSMLEFFEVIINYINRWPQLTGDGNHRDLEFISPALGNGQT